MEPPAKHEEEEEEEEPSPRPPFAAAAAISRIAVAQICLTVGYAAAEPAALRSLSDVAGRYIQILARSAASIAAVHGRTDVNLLDLVRAMEELSLPRGFAGASDPTRSLLRSSVLRELMAFVRSVHEIPFPRPIRRESVRARASPSFAQLGREPPLRHVPRWLPCFPESWERSRREEEGCGEGREREGDRVSAAVKLSEEGFLPAEWERVRFRLACYGGSDGEGKKKGEHGVEEREERKGK
ncbi:transcription initiation factor TFIID subunit 8 [Elaeis guineensis]|uniref:Transcription initiation factor TFIID subunit 8 n=1 Tax=Elaeis guineensis var. tenera TaxID=51953 RepID=A0A6I9RX77_ELAGV|nr:transcription initiation factor TFIID subunit 8 [Elaeis guineensis]